MLPQELVFDISAPQAHVWDMSFPTGFCVGCESSQAPVLDVNAPTGSSVRFEFSHSIL